MRYYLLAAVCALTTGVATGYVTGHASAAQDCTPRTAWAGIENPALNNGQALQQYPVAQPIEAQSITLSGAFAIPPGVPGPSFSEALFLAGISDSPPAVGPALVPQLADDPNFSSGTNRTTSGVVNGQVDLLNGVQVAQILKADTTGAANFTHTYTWPTPRNIPAGGVLWVRLGAAGPVLDVEAQTVLTYLPEGCPA